MSWSSSGLCWMRTARCWAAGGERRRWGSRCWSVLAVAGGARMPVGFLTGAQAAAFGLYMGPTSMAEMDRFFLLDDKASG